MFWNKKKIKKEDELTVLRNSYAASISRLDECIGELQDELEILRYEVSNMKKDLDL